MGTSKNTIIVEDRKVLGGFQPYGIGKMAINRGAIMQSRIKTIGSNFSIGLHFFITILSNSI